MRGWDSSRALDGQRILKFDQALMDSGKKNKNPNLIFHEFLSS